MFRERKIHVMHFYNVKVNIQFTEDGRRQRVGKDKGRVYSYFLVNKGYPQSQHKIDDRKEVERSNYQNGKGTERKRN